MKLSDYESETRNLGREVAQLDPAKVRERDVRSTIGLIPKRVDPCLDRPHLLVCDDEEVPRSAGRIEHPDTRHSIAKVEELAAVVTG
ncbi:MAG: hypothetical protein IT205_07065, partial [Fimbriimonadaceae bacterium]|nr:hypothetical protein [Fimbriimonadaceae bacterium]